MSHAALAVVVFLAAVGFGLASRGRGERTLVPALVLAAVAVAAHVAEVLLA